ncbi:MAG: tRNA pseudouridine(55) synthase TruB [Chitinophagales bacterium]|jgi:tRNA pseudouridine55 synthase
MVSEALEIVLPEQLPLPLPKGFVLLIDKPLGWTSFDVVNKVRYWISKLLGVKRAKVGHAGTLDPLATGLLVICVGDYTRRIDTFQGQEKEYTGTMTFGAVTASFDLEKPVEPQEPTQPLSDALIEQARSTLTGTIEQFPPVFSAVKVDGKRLYKHARKGDELELQPRQVQIDAFELSPLYPTGPIDQTEPIDIAGKGHPIWLHPDYPNGLRSDFRIVCGKGTYIRSLAFDMGERTGNGAYLSALRRTRIGQFRVEQAWNIQTLIQQIQSAIASSATV